MTLIDGYGQLGEALKEKISGLDKNIVIYHKWNVWDRSVEAQRKCYEDFCKYLDDHKDKKIVFISTKSDNDSPYRSFKLAAEASCRMCDLIIRLPILIGKGPCLSLRNGNDAYGDMELTTIDDAVCFILNSIHDTGIKVLKGISVPAYIVKELIQFGKHGI